MNLEEAKNRANSYSRNANLHWFVSPWNDGYIIHSSIYMRLFPETEYVYSTGIINKQWEIEYSKDLKRFIHVVK